jgi:hypothetical protein
MSRDTYEQRMIRLDVVRQAATTWAKKYPEGIRNMTISAHEEPERVAYQLVSLIAKHRVDHAVKVRYPENWVEALKEQLLTVWTQDPKKMRWIKLIPKRVLRKFLGSGVKYTIVAIGADAFYPAIDIPQEYRGGMFINVIEPDKRLRPWADGGDDGDYALPERFRDDWKPTEPIGGREWPKR